MKLIRRDKYISQLEMVKNIPDIKVITGVRRSGKSKLMDAFSAIIAEDKNANVVRIRLNQIRNFWMLTLFMNTLRNNTMKEKIIFCLSMKFNCVKTLSK